MSLLRYLDAASIEENRRSIREFEVDWNLVTLKRYRKPDKISVKDTLARCQSRSLVGKGRCGLTLVFSCSLTRNGAAAPLLKLNVYYHSGVFRQNGSSVMSMAPSADDFHKELIDQLDRGAKRGASHVEINSGELHRKVGGYPGPDHRMPTWCDVMRQATQEGDETASSPSEGKGAALTLHYRLPRR